MAAQSSILSSISFPTNYYNSISHSSKKRIVITKITTKVDTPRIISQKFTITSDQTSYKNDVTNPITLPPCSHLTSTAAAAATAKLHAVLEAVADRVEMHTNIGEQRNSWNSLLLNSINIITLTATTMSALTAAAGVAERPVLGLKLSSALLFAAATGLMTVVNKLQPSQLVEEQRNATRLFKQLHEQIQTMLALHDDRVTENEVNNMMTRVLALDKAYPLPLIGVVLEKFPDELEPATWWPENQFQKSDDHNREYSYMKEIVHVMKEKDKREFIKLGTTALKLNKILSTLGPILTGLAAAGSVFSGSSSSLGVLGMGIAVGGGVLGSIVNSIEHGGQVGMVFEMYRNCAGFFQFMEESIESASGMDDDEMMEMKVCLQLGRSSSQLKDLATLSASSRKDGKDIDEFASKLL